MSVFFAYVASVCFNQFIGVAWRGLVSRKTGEREGVVVFCLMFPTPTNPNSRKGEGGRRGGDTHFLACWGGGGGLGMC